MCTLSDVKPTSRGVQGPPALSPLSWRAPPRSPMSHVTRVGPGAHAGQAFLTGSSALALNCTLVAPALCQRVQVRPSSAVSTCSALSWALCEGTRLQARLSWGCRSGCAQTGEPLAGSQGPGSNRRWPRAGRALRDESVLGHTNHLRHKASGLHPAGHSEGEGRL